MPMNETVMRRRSPWAWIPTLYIAEGLPYFAVNVLTVLMYAQMGIPNDKMAFYTGCLYLPWVVKPFWSPFVDITGTKRGWVIAMQAVMAVGLGAVAAVLTSSIFFAATLVAFWVIAFASATHDIAADGYYILALDEKQQAAYVGVRSTFYRVASIAGQGGLVVLIGHMQDRGIAVPVSWQIGFAILSAIFVIFALLHTVSMPRAAADRPRRDLTPAMLGRDFAGSFVSFFRKPHIVGALAFMLLYRLPEALCVKMVQPFLVASRAEGGLALTVTQIGFINGTVGVVALLAGGIVGGLAIAKGGLRKWLWPMAASLALPCAFYLALAIFQPTDYTLIATAIGVEQFGYGFGFTAFMMYLMYFSEGKNATSHYAFCTAFMALGMMLPGMAAGWICDRLGYTGFFWFVMAACLGTVIACLSVKIPKQHAGSETK